MSQTLVAVVVAASIISTLASIISFILGVRFGAKEAGKYKPEVKVIEVPKPYVVEKTIVKEVSAPGFLYPPAGKDAGLGSRQVAEDKKFAEMVSDPEI